MTKALLIENGVIVTMDAGRRIFSKGHVLMEDGRITAIGDCAPPAPDTNATRIDASGMVVMPGLVDTHAHAGHMLTKGLGDDSEAWMNTAGRIYAEATDSEFWAAEGALSALERIKCGTTTAALLFGGGPDIMRTEAPEAAQAHLAAVAGMGVREILGVGPNRPGAAHVYRDYSRSPCADISVSPEAQLAVCARLVDDWQDRNGRLRLAITLPVFTARELEDPAVYNLSRKVRDFSREKGMLLIQDGHRGGSIAANAERLGLFDGHSLLAHCVELTEADIAALKDTGAKVAHNPSALMSVSGRCPAIELMEDGVTVSLGTDASAPDRSFDMFRNMFQAHRYHARHFRDDAVLPPMQLLEMATIEGARALSMESEIGSLELGKRADIILVNMRQPHLWPPAHPVQRLARFANGADVDTTIVDGRILMRARKLVERDEDAILDRAERAFHLMMNRAGLA
ncbi:amidohydrolase family protein [Mesorhizobium sp. B2-5-13]|uniref:amidohydrolase family protein n=1 Tax=unclassified Mesorhizobium TaxID=325217 RepID=UPI0011270D65|nr:MULTISPECIES: amidohydrolase family protein [unclassified Mesorhizobium]TPJ38361.1 amidohydrolase family protein [Mesorhizobium sp. B2-6-5]TPJ84202.1 amidohydrolase family protein [Mesorhizobium sp. B2-5-13]TPK46631.1 amidohydrolase family protein [Mesorhizobium sp. B2-5-5]TPM07968.1 amidohydrolase family protein [Mesorhizobium sp. B2-3-11]